MPSKQSVFLNQIQGVLLGLVLLSLVACSGDDVRDAVRLPSEPQTLAVTAQPAVLHPRLFFSAQDVPALRQRASTSHAALWALVAAYAHDPAAITRPVTAPADGDFNFYRASGSQILPVAFACVIENTTASCDNAKALLLTYANWTQWGENNVRDLGLAHMLMGNALAYDWLYDRLSDDERTRVRTSLGHWAQAMYEASHTTRYRSEWHNWWPESYAQNHNWINHSALGLAGLALWGEDERAVEWMNQARNKLAHVRDLLNGIDDGTWHEGIPYQSYGLSMALPFWVSLRRLTQTDDLPHGYLKNYGLWRLYNYLPNEGYRHRFVLAYGNFAWSWADGNSPQNILRFVAAEYKDAQAQWLANQLSRQMTGDEYNAPWAVLGFLYHDATIDAQPPAAKLPLARTFDDLSAVIWRTGWEDNALVFGLKSGPFGGHFAFNSFVQKQPPWANCYDCDVNVGHDHADANSFYLFKAGQWLAPSVIKYDAMDTALGNTMLVNGQGQWRPGYEAIALSNIKTITESAHIETTANTSDFSYVAADASAAYPPAAKLTRFVRQVLFVRPGYFIMADDLVAQVPSTFEWVSHVGGPASGIQVDGNWVRGDGNASDGQSLGINVVAPAPFAYRTGAQSDGDDKEWGYIATRPVQPTTSAHLVHLLYPTTQAGWASRPQVKLVQQDADSMHVRVQLTTPITQTDEVMISHDASKTQPRIGVLSRRADAVYVFVAGSGTFTLDGVDWVRGWQGGALQVRAAGEQVTIEAPQARTGDVLQLYSPSATRVTLNGQPVSFTRDGDMITLLNTKAP